MRFSGCFIVTTICLAWKPETHAWVTPPVCLARQSLKTMRRANGNMFSGTDISRDAQGDEFPDTRDANQPSSDFDPSTRRQGFGLQRILIGAGIAASASCAEAHVALAKFIDPDEIGVGITKSELPPPWIPVVVVAVLSVGIFLLQQSLGDIVEDEARLGRMSGARAAKQSARDRNMFKKKK